MIQSPQDDTRFRAFADASTDIIACCSPEGHLTYISPAVTPILGYRPDELIGKVAISLYHPEDRALAVQAFRRLLDEPPGAQALTLDHRMIHKNGTSVWIQSRPSVRRDPGSGALIEAYDCLRDITPLREAERRLQIEIDAKTTARDAAERSEAQYWMLADSAQDICLKVGRNGQISYASSSVRDLGYQPEEMSGRLLLDFVHPDDKAELIQVLAERFSSAPGTISPGATLRALRADGTFAWLEGRPTAVRDEDGQITHFNTVLRDVSRQRALEADLREALSRAESAAAAKSEFLANMSHELRTPLTSVIGFSQLVLAEPDLSDVVRRSVDRIASGGKVLLATINDILDIAKIESGDAQIDPIATAIDPLLREAADLMAHKVQEKGLSLILEGLDALPAFVRLDPHRTRQVVLNLLGNAVKFTERGCVSLSALYNPATDSLTVSVSDTGLGIPEERVKSLFQRFSQVDGSVSRRFGGTGLGLAISKGLSEAMGGEIGVRSVEGQGSTFWFQIPAPVTEPDAPSTAQSDDLAPGQDRRVLIVDDNTENCEVVKAILQSFNLEVDIATDGQSGIEAAELAAYDIILMDLRMPGMDGVEATRAIREGRGPNRYAPILLCSADGDAVKDGDNALFDGKIMKPFSPANLLGQVAAAMDDLPDLSEAAA